MLLVFRKFRRPSRETFSKVGTTFRSLNDDVIKPKRSSRFKSLEVAFELQSLIDFFRGSDRQLACLSEQIEKKFSQRQDRFMTLLLAFDELSSNTCLWCMRTLGTRMPTAKEKSSLFTSQVSRSKRLHVTFTKFYFYISFCTSVAVIEGYSYSLTHVCAWRSFSANRTFVISEFRSLNFGNF